MMIRFQSFRLQMKIQMMTFVELVYDSGRDFLRDPESKIRAPSAAAPVWDKGCSENRD